MDNTAEKLTPAPEIPLNQYLAIQVGPRESHAVAVEAFCTTAKMMGALFRRVETVGSLTVGMKSFLRMRTDLDRTRIREVLRKMVEVTGRGVVYVTDEGRYEVQFPLTVYGGRKGTVSSGSMHTLSLGPFVLYRGPKIKRWREINGFDPS